MVPALPFVSLLKRSLCAAKPGCGRVPFGRSVQTNRFQGGFRDRVMRPGAIRWQGGVERVVIGNSSLNELVENLTAKRLPSVRGILRPIVLPEVVHDALCNRVRRALCF